MLNQSAKASVQTQARCNGEVQSDEDLFDSDGEDVFNEIDENFDNGIEEAQAAAPSEFKLPNLSDFESKLSKSVTPGKFKFEQRKQNTSSDGSPSPVLVRKRRNVARLSSDEEEEGDEMPKAFSKREDVSSSSDSTLSRSEAGARPNYSSSDEESPAISRQARKKRRKNLANAFLDLEAEMSSDGDVNVSSDEDSGEDAFEASFVDDASQRVDADQRAMYLRSIKSPSQSGRGRPQRRLRPVTADIFSQAVDVDAEQDTYMDDDDSFCVRDDVEIEYDSRFDTLDLAEAGLAHIEDRGRGRRSRGTRGLRDGGREVRGRRRCRGAVASSSSEDEAEPKPRKAATETRSSDESERELRLRKQKELKEKFQRQQEAKKLQEMGSAPALSHSSTDSFQKVRQRSCSRRSESFEAAEQSTYEASKDILAKSGASVLVNSSEVHRCQEVISCLRHEQGLAVHVNHFAGAGFLLSPRMAAERRLLAEACNGANRKRLVEQCQAMNDLFERPCLIFEETDKDKERGKANDMHRRTKYVDLLMSQLSQCKIKVLFSSSQMETASILAALIRSEERKGFILPRPLALTLRDKQVLPFLQSLPGVGFGTALQLAASYASVRDVVNSAKATLMQRLNVDETRAQRIHEYLRANFQSDMTDAGLTSPLR
jgi:ERCC4-type nuclease